MEKLTYNTMVFCVEEYNNNFEAMWADIAKVTSILLKNKNVVVTHAEDFDVVVLEYEHDEEHNEDYWGTSTPKWVTAEEAEMIDDNRKSIFEDIIPDSNKELLN